MYKFVKIRARILVVSVQFLNNPLLHNLIITAAPSRPVLSHLFLVTSRSSRMPMFLVG